MDYVDTLDKVFSRLVEDIGYIFVDDEGHLKVAQKSGLIRIRNIYFDIKEGHFIKYSTIRRNKHALMKLKEYQSQGKLLCFIPTDSGYRVRVYDKYGELIYKNTIKFFDKLGLIRTWLMKKRYEELCLDA
jgi:hypothetical protein